MFGLHIHRIRHHIVRGDGNPARVCLCDGASRTALAAPLVVHAWRSTSSFVGPGGRRLPGHFGHTVKCGRIRLAVSRVLWRQQHSIRRPGERPRLAFVGPVVGACRAASGIW